MGEASGHAEELIKEMTKQAGTEPKERQKAVGLAVIIKTAIDLERTMASAEEI